MINNKKNSIWYVCYGSNLCLERFMCYLTGKGSEKYNVDSNPEREYKDQSLPRRSKLIKIPFIL